MGCDSGTVFYIGREWPYRSAHKRAGAPLGPKNTIFLGFLPSTYVICIFAAYVLKFFLCGTTEEVYSMVKAYVYT